MQKAKITITRTKTCKGVLVQRDPFYNTDTVEPKSIWKRRKNFRQISEIESIEKEVEWNQENWGILNDCRVFTLETSGKKTKSKNFTVFFLSEEGCAGDASDDVSDDGDSNVNSDFELMEEPDADFSWTL